jgi:hypothetical protein
MADVTREEFERLNTATQFLLQGLGGLISVLSKEIRNTRCDLLALALLLAQKGITIEREEWEAASKEMAAAYAVDQALDPRTQRSEEIVNRLARGEEVGDDELQQWLGEIIDEERKDDDR